jgi:hypothetical protein
MDDVVVQSQSQRLVQLKVNCDRTIFKNEHILFEPAIPFPVGCLVARSCHLKATEQLYCNVLNASDQDITLKQDQLIGILSDCEMANNQFDRDVKEYIPLDVTRLIHISGKTCSSTPIANKKAKPPQLSTYDIIENQI